MFKPSTIPLSCIFPGKPRCSYKSVVARRMALVVLPNVLTTVLFFYLHCCKQLWLFQEPTRLWGIHPTYVCLCSGFNFHFTGIKDFFPAKNQALHFLGLDQLPVLQLRKNCRKYKWWLPSDYSGSGTNLLYFCQGL